MSCSHLVFDTGKRAGINRALTPIWKRLEPEFFGMDEAGDADPAEHTNIIVGAVEQVETHPVATAMLRRGYDTPMRFVHVVAIRLGAFDQERDELRLASEFEAAIVIEPGNIASLERVIDNRAVLNQWVAVSNIERICLRRNALTDQQGDGTVSHFGDLQLELTATCGQLAGDRRKREKEHGHSGPEPPETGNHWHAD